MTPGSPSLPGPPEKSPGKLRTWWHPLLVAVFRWQLANCYRIDDEVPLGRKPLQLDAVVLRQNEGDLSEESRRLLAGIYEVLNKVTLVEFKSPTDDLAVGDFLTFLAYAYLYVVQTEPELVPSELSLVVLAPRLTKGYREELERYGVTHESQGRGRWRLRGGVVAYPMWVIETSELDDVTHPVIAVFSPRVLKDPQGLYRELRDSGQSLLMAYLAQQIHQFRLRGDDFAMQHLGMDKEARQAWRELLDALPLEERLEGLSSEELLARVSVEERLKGVPAEERLKGVPAEERLKGVPAEERLKGVPAEERLKGVPAEERLKGVPAEERLKGVPAEERLKGVPAEERLKGVPAEERAMGLSPEELDRLFAKLLQTRQSRSQNPGDKEERSGYGDTPN